MEMRVGHLLLEAIQWTRMQTRGKRNMRMRMRIVETVMVMVMGNPEATYLFVEDVHRLIMTTR